MVVLFGEILKGHLLKSLKNVLLPVAHGHVSCLVTKDREWREIDP